MEVPELIQNLREQKKKVLNKMLRMLPTDLQREYIRLGVCIKETRKAEIALSSSTQRLLRSESLSNHKKLLIAFITENGSASKLDIKRKLKIPAGSITKLLKDQDFVKASRGLWTLRASGESE